MSLRLVRGVFTFMQGSHAHPHSNSNMHHVSFLTFQESTLQFARSAWGILGGRARHAKRDKARAMRTNVYHKLLAT